MKHIRFSILLLLLLSMLCARAQQAGDWASFRGNPSMTGVAVGTLTPPLKQRWCHEAGSGVESTAAIVGDFAYVGTQKGELLALRMADGKLKWKYAAGAAISASPCVVGSTVYAGDENGVFHALNISTGKQRWQFKAEDKIISSATPAPGVVSSAPTMIRSIAWQPAPASSSGNSTRTPRCIARPVWSPGA